MFSSKSLLYATIGVIAGFYIIDNILPSLPVIGNTSSVRSVQLAPANVGPSSTAYVP